jgi:uncharacterized protein YndB with AHSA1/START domain
MNHELAIDTFLDAPVAAVWRAWTEHLEQWWCPPPWRAELQALELRPGGRFAATMTGPDGARCGGESVILEVVAERRVVFTNALLPGWQPQTGDPFAFVGRFEFASERSGTRYRASASHWSAEACEQHRATVGFEEGWLVIAKQLEEVARGLAGLPAEDDALDQAKARDPLSC